MIYFIRHGQVASNAKNLIIGRYDEELNDVGISQAQAVANEIKNVTYAGIIDDKAGNRKILLIWR